MATASHYKTAALIRRRAARAWLRPTGELAVMLVVILALGFFAHRSDPFFVHVDPSPWWVPVLLMSVRYGMPFGPAAGAACAGLHLCGLSHEGLWLRESFQLGGYELLVPMLYVLVGGFVAGAIEQLDRRHDVTVAQLRDTRSRLEVIDSKRGELEQAYRQVEGRLAGRADAAVAVIDQARHLTAADPDEIYAGLVGLLTPILDAQRVSVWRPNADGVFHRILPSIDATALLPALAQAVLNEGRVLSAAEVFATATAPADAGVLAGPLRTIGLRIDAVVVVEELRFVAFTPTAVRRFELLIDWASRALALAARAAERERAPEQPRGFGSGSAGSVSGRFPVLSTRNELASLEHASGPATVLIARIGGDAQAVARARLEQVVVRVCRHLCRPGDVVAYREHACVMYLPGAVGGASQALRSRVERCLAAFDFRPHVDGTALRLAWSSSETAGGVAAETLIAQVLAQPVAEVPPSTTALPGTASGLLASVTDATIGHSGS